jgi:ABC-type multidrug transport system fused ATPase/permease subunit
MEKASGHENKSTIVLPRGIYTIKDSSLALNIPQSKEYGRWVYVTARVLVLIVAMASFIGSMLLAADGSWDIATIGFIFDFVLFIPFILYGRKIRKMKKSKNVNRGWL